MHRGISLSQAQYEAAFAAFERGIAAAGGQTPMAKICGCSQGAISQRVAARKLLVAEHVLKVEAATGVSRHELRPDLYPIDDLPTGQTLGSASLPRPSDRIVEDEAALSSGNRSVFLPNGAAG